MAHMQIRARHVLIKVLSEHITLGSQFLPSVVPVLSKALTYFLSNSASQAHNNKCQQYNTFTQQGNVC